MVNVLDNVRIAENIGISQFTKKQLKPKSISIANNLLFCNNLACYDNFRIRMRENKKFLLELRESMFIMRDQPYLNRIITSAPLYPFESLF